MTNDNQDANAGASKESPVVESNITISDYIANRSRAKEEAKAPAKDAPESEPKEPVEAKAEVKESVEDKAETPEAKEVLSKDKDLDDMSEAEIRELADKLGSRAVARFGELTAKRKAAEEQLAALRAELQAREQAVDPLASQKKQEDNPYKDIKTLSALQAKAQEVEEVIEWADEVLWNSDHLSVDDVVANINGQELTKVQVRKALRDAQKARKEHLPKQLANLQAEAQRFTLKANFDSAARKELDWLEKDDSDLNKQYKTLKASPVLEKAIKATPELEPYMDYMVAHATNSIYGRKSIPLTTPVAAVKKSITPPSNPSSSTAQSERVDSTETKTEKAASKRFRETSDVNDFVALRTEQISKRKTLRL